MANMGWILIVTMVGLALIIAGAQLSSQEDEEGDVEDSGDIGSDEDNRILDVCLQSHSHDMTHYHANLEISIRGENRIIPTSTGVTSTCMSGIHTHGDDGTLHIETPGDMEARIEHFFTIWDQPLSETQLMEATVGQGELITMTVDGVVVEDYQNHIFVDGQQVTIKLE
jgi:hypothetical protein